MSELTIGAKVRDVYHPSEFGEVIKIYEGSDEEHCILVLLDAGCDQHSMPIGKNPDGSYFYGALKQARYLELIDGIPPLIGCGDQGAERCDSGNTTEDSDATSLD